MSILGRGVEARLGWRRKEKTVDARFFVECRSVCDGVSRSRIGWTYTGQRLADARPPRAAHAYQRETAGASHQVVAALLRGVRRQAGRASAVRPYVGFRTRHCQRNKSKGG